MGCGGSKVKLSPSGTQFMTMISSKPSLKKYAKNKENLKTLEKAIASPLFGGSVLLPIAAPKGKRTKSNPLREEVEKLNIEVTYGGGYYMLNHIQVTETVFYDIYILVQNVQDVSVQHKLKTIHDRSTNIPLKKGAAAVQPSQTHFDEIKDSLTGFARIIKYTNTRYDPMSDSESCEILGVEEGQFAHGKKNGYCRVISALDGSAECGWFIEDEVKGKFCKYNREGTYDFPEGFYEGENCS